MKHSLAVDAAKEGTIIVIPPRLRVKSYPDFMNKQDKLTYKSSSIFGQVFRKFDSGMLVNAFHKDKSEFRVWISELKAK